MVGLSDRQPYSYTLHAQQHQSNPESPNSTASAPPGQQIQCALPTPLHPNPPPLRDNQSPERRLSLSPGPGSTNASVLSPIHPRPIPRLTTPQCLSKLGI
ncbi:hypothetical protein VKT23_020583 [Stygiomarasmius scandens]|uniref:Uncharacterized protein n=1 Tax=Marasmiellus scandens TaxID=2682957 RepID=A0ABR1IML4_9AGAR